MASVHAPTLLYPNGGEKLASPTIKVRWQSPTITDETDRPVWYELYYADSYVPGEEPNWIAIATVPSSVNEFEWRVGRGLTSDSVRVCIRSRNSQGTRSVMSVSAANFSVNRSVLPKPQIISPVVNGRYDSTIQIVVSSDRLPDRSYYQFYYSSKSAGIPMTAIGQKTLVRDIPVAWITVDLPPADDYAFYATILGPDGGTSEMAYVSNFSIAHEGFFIIDTLPPEASVRVEKTGLFTNQPDVSVSVYAYDEATGVQSLQVFDDSANKGIPQAMRVRTSHTLSTGDGLKEVRALVQDFGANRNVDENEAFALVSLTNTAPIANANVVDFAVSYDLEVTFVHLVTVGSTENALYEFTITADKVGFPRRVMVIADKPTAVAGFQSEEYVATVDDEGVGHLIKYLTTGWVNIYTFGIGEQVTDLEVHNDYLYVGTNTGSIYRCDGGKMESLTSGTDALTFDGDIGEEQWGMPSIRRLQSDGNKLFVLFENSSKVAVIIGSYLMYR